MIVEKACWERGCACYDYRLDEGVEVTLVREWQGMTDEEVNEYKGKVGLYFVREIEAKLREKNA